MVNMKMLYDACRKYKYFYKRYEAVKGLKDEYGYDKDVRCLAEKFEDELSDAYDELCTALLHPYLRSNVVEFEVEYPDNHFGFHDGRMYGRCIPYGAYVTHVHGKDFSDLIQGVVNKARSEMG